MKKGECKLKPFWKRVNRGLLLGAVLLVVLIVMAVVQTISFRQAKPAIRQEVKSYVNDLLSITYVEGENITPGTELTDAQKQARRDRLEELIGKHWKEVSQKEISSGALLTGKLAGTDSLRVWFESTLLGGQDPIDQLNLPIISDSDISISANGPGYAQVSVFFSFSTISRKMEFGTENDFEKENRPEAENQPEAEKLSEKKVESGKQGVLQLELKRVNGNWKVIAANFSVMDTWENRDETTMGGQK